MLLVNWTNQVAIHQSALMRGIVEMGWDATLVAHEPASNDRLAMGWTIPEMGKVKTVLKPDQYAIDALLENEPQSTVHIFGAALQYPWGWYALSKATFLGCRIGIMSEASDPDGWKALLRWVKHRAIAATFGRRMQFLLAMGELGVRWFRLCGHAMYKIFPFGYFVEPPQWRIDTGPAYMERSLSFHVLFCGQLIPRKRVDLLIHAMSLLHSDSTQLTIIGDGPERVRLERLASELGIAQVINWRGALPNQEARKVIENVDLLILPSHYDGWGAVVNEALMAGTPVICTDHCGASDLVRESWRGEVIPRNDSKALAAAIRRRIEQGPLTEKQRERIQNWSKCITGKAAAQYLQSVLDYVYGEAMRPTPPWRSAA